MLGIPKALLLAMVAVWLPLPGFTQTAGQSMEEIVQRKIKRDQAISELNAVYAACMQQQNAYAYQQAYLECASRGAGDTAEGACVKQAVPRYKHDVDFGCEVLRPTEEDLQYTISDALQN